MLVCVMPNIVHPNPQGSSESETLINILISSFLITSITLSVHLNTLLKRACFVFKLGETENTLTVIAKVEM